MSGPRRLTGRDYWDVRYRAAPEPPTAPWEPRSYEQRLLAKLLAGAVTTGTRRILEVGCGDSPWLAWLGRHTSVRVTGLDYSPAGCRRARQRLAAAAVPGEVICADLFSASAELVGRHDLVFSLGVVEHFTSPALAIASLARFLHPGGRLLTVVPDLRSLHGLAVAAWQPRVLRRHVLMSVASLAEAHREAGLAPRRLGRLGTMSFEMVAWGVDPRWPSLERALAPLLMLIRRAGGRALRLLPTLPLPGLSPFAYVIAERARS